MQLSNGASRCVSLCSQPSIAACCCSAPLLCSARVSDATRNPPDLENESLTHSLFLSLSTILAVVRHSTLFFTHPLVNVLERGYCRTLAPSSPSFQVTLVTLVDTSVSQRFLHSVANFDQRPPASASVPREKYCITTSFSKLHSLLFTLSPASAHPIGRLCLYVSLLYATPPSSVVL